MSNPSDFTIKDGVLKKYKGRDGVAIIPEGVIEIGKDAFREGETEVPCSSLRRGFDYKTFREEGSLKSVTFPSTLRRIKESAFQGCVALTTLELPEALEEIGALAFFGCEKLTGFHISENNAFFETIDGVLFRKQEKELLSYPAGKPDSSYTIPRGMEAVASNAFSRTPALEEIIIPNTVWRFEDRAFMDPAPLMDKFTTYDQFFQSIQIEPGGKQKQVGSNVFNFKGGKDLFDYYHEAKGPLYYPGLPIDFVKEKAVQTRLALGFCTMSELYTEPYRNGYEAYVKKNQKSLLKKAESLGLSEVSAFFSGAKTGGAITKDFIIRDGVLIKYIGAGEDVTIPEGVTEIEKGVFSNSKSLMSVTFPESLKIIGVEAFASCKGLTSVAIPPSVTEIRFGAFDWCDNLKDVFIRDLAAWCRIEFGGVYANCGNPLSAGARLYVNGEVLTDLVIPEGIETVNDYAFYHCVSLESASITKGVTVVGNYAFFDCANLKSASLSESVVSIGNGAFCGCKKLAEVNIPRSVNTIGEVAFMDCRKLTDVILPEGVELLGNQAFGGCGKLKVSLPGSLKRPKADMFGQLWRKAPFAGSTCSIQIEKWSVLITKMVEGCTVEEITTGNYALIPGEILLPAAVNMMKKKDWDPASETGKALLKGLEKSAGKLRAAALTNAEWLQLLCDNRLIKAEDLDAWLEEAEKQDNAEAKAVLLNYQNSLGSTAVEKAREKKEKVKENYADSLVERAAKRDPSKGIEGMTFVITGQFKAWPKVWSSRKAVEEYLAKYGAKLGASLTIETDYLVTNDTDSGSKKNEKAKSLGVEVINEEEFNQMIGRRFMDAETIRVPSWVKTIEPAAFSIPEWEAWRNGICFKNLKEVILPEQITAIGEKAFAGAGNLEKINMPDAVTSIGRWAFAGCEKLTEIELPKSLVNIGARAFDGCKMLKTVSVPEGVKSIGIGAFGSCSSLEEIRIPGSVVIIESDAFDIAGFKDSGNLTIVAPKGSCAEDFARNNGIAFAAEGDMSDLKDSPKDAAAETIEQEPPEASDPADFAIKNGFLGKYVGIGGRVVIPDGVTAVGYMAFENCANLTEVVIPEGVKSIGWNAFQGCVGLKRVKLPDTLKQIEINAFKNCGSLAEIRIPAGVTEIGGGAFEDCGGLTNLTIPESVTNIADRAFTGCRGLKDAEGFVIIRNVLYSYLGHGGDVAVPKGVTRIGGNAFHQCAGVTSVTLPEGVTDIGAFAFDNCTDLQRVVLPEGVTNIGIYAFCNCSALKEIVIPGSVTSIGKKAFSDCVSLESITIPGSVPVIEEELFYNCSKLREVRLSEGVEGLGKSVFLFCDGLKEIWLPASFKKMGRDNSFARCTIHAPAKSFAEKYAKKNKITFVVWEKE